MPEADPDNGVLGAVSLDRSRLRRATGSFLTGVTVVTTLDASGQRHGMTASSFTTVSADPPLVLICVRHGSQTYPAFRDCSSFAVSVVADDQIDVARRFAKSGEDKFAGLPVRSLVTGAPVVEGAVSWIDCVTWERHDAGDHLILIGEVVAVDFVDGRPLGYCLGNYLSMSPERSISQIDRSTVHLSWLIETEDGIVLSRGPDGRLGLPHLRRRNADLGDQALRQYARQITGITVQTPFLFSVFNDPNEDALVVVYRARSSIATVESTADLVVVAADAVPWDELPPLPRGLVQRYLLERDSESFGIYSGTAAGGRVAVATREHADWDEYVGGTTGLS